MKHFLSRDEWDIDQSILNRSDHLVPEERMDGDAAEIVRKRVTEYKNRGDFSGGRIGILINDQDRPTPSYLVLEELLKQFPDLSENVSTVYIATGSHRKTTRIEVEKLLGETYDTFKDRIVIHDSSDRSEHENFGSTTRGTDVVLQGSLEDHDKLILVNSVEPHYFAGFTGGRKSLFPGMAFKESIEQNHSLALDRDSAPLRLKGNPVHEDMEEASDIFLMNRDHVSIQIVQGPGIPIADIFIGDIKRSFREAVSLSGKLFSIDVDHLYDIVVTKAMPPMDTTLYQAQKALENGKSALKDGGIMILVASLSEGIGRSAFWDLVTSHEDPREVLREIREGYKLGYHKAARLVDLNAKARVFVVSQMDNSTLSKGFMEGYKDLKTAIEEAMNRSGKDPSILFIPDGTVTIPNLVRNEK